MSQPLKQSGVACGAFGLYLLHEFMCRSRGDKKRALWFCLRLQLRAKHKFWMRSCWFKYLRGWGVCSREDRGLKWREHVENTWIANRGMWHVQYQLMQKKIFEKQKTSHHAVESTNYISKTDTVGGFIFFSVFYFPYSFLTTIGFCIHALECGFQSHKHKVLKHSH